MSDTEPRRVHSDLIRRFGAQSHWQLLSSAIRVEHTVPRRTVWLRLLVEDLRARGLATLAEASDPDVADIVLNAEVRSLAAVNGWPA